MMEAISQRIQQIKPSATIAISAKASELKAAGVDVINMSVGEPDFTTPTEICDAAIQAIRAGKTHYPAADGTTELKSAIIDKFARENALRYEPQQILVSCGAKHSLYNAMQAIINPGDEVLIPTPYWVSYPAQTLLAEGRPVFVPTRAEDKFLLTAEALEAAITPKTRALIINSPSNPSGMCYSLEHLRNLAEVLLRHPDIIIISDDIYEHLLWKTGGFHNIVNACPELYERSIVVNGVSKAYAMTGWRIGYLGAPQSLVSAMKKIQSHATSGACSIAQAAATQALTGEQNCLTEMLHAYQARHDLVYQALVQMPGIETHPADGTFYQFPNVEKACLQLGIEDDFAFCQALLEKAHIAAVPGSAFGSPGHVRFSYATSDTLLTEAMQRLHHFLS